MGTLALSVGLLAGLLRADGRGAGTARFLATAAGVIGTLQVLVLEYDSDVPQFSTLWFLPVASLGLCTAAALLDDLLPGRWAPANAALLYTGLRAGAKVTTTVPASQLPASVLLGAAAGFFVALVHGDLRITRPPAMVTPSAAVFAVLALSLGGTPEPACAHDPGPGEQVRAANSALRAPATRLNSRWSSRAPVTGSGRYAPRTTGRSDADRDAGRG